MRDTILASADAMHAGLLIRSTPASTANRNRHGPQHGGHLSLVRQLERKVTSHAIGIIRVKDDTQGGYMNLQVDHYCDVIIERWERETGREAVLDEQE